MIGLESAPISLDPFGLRVSLSCLVEKNVYLKKRAAIDHQR